MPSPRHVVQVGLIAGVVAYAAHAIAGFAAGSSLFEDWLYDALLVGAALLRLARGLVVSRERVAWLGLGGRVAPCARGVIDLTLHPELQEGAFPSRADVLSQAFYPAANLPLI